MATVALLVLVSPAVAADDDVDDEFGEQGAPFDCEWWDFGKAVEFDYPRRISAPFDSGSNHFLHHLVLIPSPEGFRIVEPKKVAVDLGLEALRETNPGEKEGNRFVASYWECHLKLAATIGSVFELRAAITGGWFHPDSRDSFSLTQEGVEVTPPGGMDPSPGVGNLLLGVKILSAFEEKDRLGLSTILTLKIPVGKKDFLSSGRGDFSISFAASARISLGSGHHLFAHANAGVSFFDEENVFPEKVYLDPCAFYSLSLVLPFSDETSPLGTPCALGLWAQGNTNVFRKMDLLSTDPVSVHGGFRIGVEGWTFDISAGFGANKAGAADFVANMNVGRDF